MGDTFPKFRAAAVQAAPVFLNREATWTRLVLLLPKPHMPGESNRVSGSFFTGLPVLDASRESFPEHSLIRRACQNAVEVPSPISARLCGAARKAGAYVVIGINERR